MIDLCVARTDGTLYHCRRTTAGVWRPYVQVQQHGKQKLGFVRRLSLVRSAGSLHLFALAANAQVYHFTKGGTDSAWKYEGVVGQGTPWQDFAAVKIGTKIHAMAVAADGGAWSPFFAWPTRIFHLQRNTGKWSSHQLAVFFPVASPPALASAVDNTGTIRSLLHVSQTEVYDLRYKPGGALSADTAHPNYVATSALCYGAFGKTDVGLRAIVSNTGSWFAGTRGGGKSSWKWTAHNYGNLVHVGIAAENGVVRYAAVERSSHLLPSGMPGTDVGDRIHFMRSASATKEDVIKATGMAPGTFTSLSLA